MPTVMLTTTCQNACPWCFARSKMEYYQSQDITEMGWQDFVTTVGFYERSDYRQMNLLGGEPTAHSRFVEILRYLTSRGFSALVVTNGIVPATVVDALVQEKFSTVQYALNSTSYFDHGPDTRRTVDHFLRAMAHTVNLSYTITRRDLLRTSLEMILDRLFLIMRFGTRPHLQFQIAVPSHGNRDFVPFDQYGAVVELLQRWTQVLQKNRVSVGLDCHCIPACCLPADTQLPFPLTSACTNFMVDIGPNLEVWPCFPLSAQTFKLDQFDTLAELRAFFSNQVPTEPLLHEGACAACEQRMSQTCDAGCRGFQILRRARLREDDVETEFTGGLAQLSQERTPVLERFRASGDF